MVIIVQMLILFDSEMMVPKLKGMIEMGGVVDASSSSNIEHAMVIFILKLKKERLWTFFR